jgi:cystathionine gamma-synthase
MDQQDVSPETLAAQGLGEADPVSGGLAPVINLSTNYEQQPDGSYPQGRVYTRADNPTSEHAEQLLAALEGGLEAAAPARCSARGWRRPPRCSSRCCPATTSWSPASCTGACASGWPNSPSPGAWTSSSPTPATWPRWPAAIRPGRTRLLWVETPANPMWEITDLAAVCDLAHAAGVRVAVDNTVATPVLTRPFEFGADLVVHSATKYLNGHGDVLAGAVLAARRDPFWERIRSWRRNAGAMPGPFEAWLLQRGMRTLFLRVHRASETAHQIAAHFRGPSRADGGALPRAAGPPGPRDRGPADERRVRRHAVHPGGRRRRARPRRAGRRSGCSSGPPRWAASRA